MTENITFRPQEGFQKKFLSSPADIVIGGGAAGAGKTFALTLEMLRNVNEKGFSALGFRRTYRQVTAPGGLWDETQKIYPLFGGKPNSSQYSWKFPSTASITFSHLQYEKNVFDWQGSQIALIVFDELTHFTEKMFFYMLSRNRSVCGVKPYVRATCNPDADSWVAKFINWWIGEDGKIMKERDGVIRYFYRANDDIIWGDSREDVYGKVKPTLDKMPIPDTAKLDLIKSVTFIEGNIKDNKELLGKDPAYLANLHALPEEDRAQLLDGNWKIRINENEIVKYEKFLDVFTNTFVPSGKKYLTADIALLGSDTLLVGAWDGWRLIGFKAIPKSEGNEVEQVIKEMAFNYEVPYSNIVFDADGVGGFLGGYIPGGISFHGGSSPIGKTNATTGEAVNLNFKNLRAECYFNLAKRINSGQLYIAPEVAEGYMPDGKTTFKEEALKQRKAIRRDKPDYDQKIAVIPKEKMKEIMNGISPDIFDMLMMREIFELVHTEIWVEEW